MADELEELKGRSRNLEGANKKDWISFNFNSISHEILQRNEGIVRTITKYKNKENYQESNQKNTR
jgi:hypothetical protein